MLNLTIWPLYKFSLLFVDVTTRYTFETHSAPYNLIINDIFSPLLTQKKSDDGIINVYKIHAIIDLQSIMHAV